MKSFFCLILAATLAQVSADNRPNILLCISDDQSYAHTSANGDPVIQTPAFDRIAREGLRFTHAFCDAPTCGPSRSALITGQPIWRLEEAGNLWSTLPSKFATYTDLLRDAGYKVGHTGKGWGPGRLEPGGRTINPAGEAFQSRKQNPAFKQIRNTDYAGNFTHFLKTVQADQPFCFWLGTSEPHRAFEDGAGVKTGKDLNKIIVPPIFPDDAIVRSDIADYLVEIEHFDKHVARAIATLEAAGKLDDTLIVITSDHGMAFPRAKASLYDHGTRIPLAIRWPGGIKNPGRTIDAFVNLSDLAPTFLEAAGHDIPDMMTGRPLTNIFKQKPTPNHTAAFIAMERHAGCRIDGKGYPCRAIRTKDHLYIHNFDPTRWPAGTPDQMQCVRAIPYGEVDPAPTKTLMMERTNDPAIAKLADLAFGKRPAEELYDLKTDPHQMNNLAGTPEAAEIQKQLHDQLFAHLTETKDPRATGGEADWDHYPFYRKPMVPNWSVAPKPKK